MKNLPVKVEFRGAVLEGVIDNGRPYVAMRPIVEALGMNWTRQLEKLRGDPVLGPELSNIRGMVAEDGKRREMVCLPEELLQGWLFKVNPSKVKPGTREKVTAYQRECYRVLREAFAQSEADANARVLAIDSKRAAGRFMTDVLQDVRQFDGKDTKPHHFSTEHKLCNWALNGKFASIDEYNLTAEEACMLAKIRRRNAVLIARGLRYEARKPLLRLFAEDLRSATLPLIRRAA